MAPKPLSGWRVLVPRGGKWGDGVASALRTRGATPVIAPMINFARADNVAALANAMHELQDGLFDWLVITSATTVDVLMSLGVRIPGSTKIAAIGETTAAAVSLAGYHVDFVPLVDNSVRGILKEWSASQIAGRVLIPQSDIADPTLVAGLARLQLQVEFVTAYRTVAVAVAADIKADVASGRIGAILVSSGSVARQIAAQLAPLTADTIVACIGPRTAFDARAAGLRVDLIAGDRSTEALIEALVDYASEAN